MDSVLCPNCGASIGPDRVVDSHDEITFCYCCAGCLAVSGHGYGYPEPIVVCAGALVKRLIDSIRPGEPASVGDALEGLAAPPYLTDVPEVARALGLAPGLLVTTRRYIELFRPRAGQQIQSESEPYRVSVPELWLRPGGWIDPVPGNCQRVAIPEGGEFVLQRYGVVGIEAGSVFLIDGSRTNDGWYSLRKPDCPGMLDRVDGWRDVQRLLASIYSFL